MRNILSSTMRSNLMWHTGSPRLKIWTNFPKTIAGSQKKLSESLIKLLQATNSSVIACGSPVEDNASRFVTKVSVFQDSSHLSNPILSSYTSCRYCFFGNNMFLSFNSSSNNSMPILYGETGRDAA